MYFEIALGFFSNRLLVTTSRQIISQSTFLSRESQHQFDISPHSPSFFLLPISTS